MVEETLENTQSLGETVQLLRESNMSHSSQQSLGLRCIFHKDFVNKWDKRCLGIGKVIVWYSSDTGLKVADTERCSWGLDWIV